jgi:ABC-type multidrug transport system ATPase subunit
MCASRFGAKAIVTPPAATALTPLVALYEAEKRYGSRVALRINRFGLNVGDWAVIIGGNGSGKSTLLRGLSGVSVLSTGRVVRSSEYEALRICFVPQSGGLQLNLTLADNVLMWQRLVGRDPWELGVDQCYIHRFGLQRYLRTRCGELSGGYQRLAAFACALAVRPDGLLVDEPLSGVDESHRKELIDGFDSARATLRLLVVTSHSIDDFEAANRVFDLGGGHSA